MSLSSPSIRSNLSNASSAGFVVTVMALLFSLALFGLVATQSAGFDDEMANMELIEHLGTWSTVKLMQTEDVHPPGGYLLNGLLFDALKDWSAVRGVSALLYALSATFLVSSVMRRQGWQSATLAFVFMVLSPAALMWCTSLRWYAYFVPLLIWAFVTPDDSSRRWYYVKPALAWLTMGYINYSALLLTPVLLLWYWLHSGLRFWDFVQRSWALWLVAGLAFAPQLFIFFTVHARNAEGQAGGLVKAAIGFAISMASNQGLFPISGWGIASMMAWGLLLALMFKHARLDRGLRSTMWTLAVAVGVFLATGLAGKFRNLVLLSPLQALMVSSAEPMIRRSWLATTSTVVIVLANAVGCMHVAQHRDTAKNGWNLPVSDVVTRVRELSTECGERPVVYTFDPVLARALRRDEPTRPVANYFDRFDKVLTAQSHCAIVINTYKGALPADRFLALKTAEASMGGETIRVVQIQKDAQAELKRKLDPDFPDYVVELKLIRGSLNLQEINNWAGSRK